MQLTGARIIIECLKEQEVDTVFGYPGGAILNVYDELYKNSSDINHILTSHEQGAAHSADGYARATGKVGVCMATSGPGATNLVTGIATAYMDSIPMVAITCNVAVSLLGKDSFQEIDITGVTMPITKHNFIVKDVKELADTIRKAFYIANTGRKGPVLIDIPKDVTASKTEYIPQKKEAITQLLQRESKKDSNLLEEDSVNKIVQLIEESKKPFVFVGGGCILGNASRQVREFVEKIDAPVTDTLMGKGAFDGSNPYYFGMLGMHGTKPANYGVSECDLLIVLGARFSDRVYGNAKKFASNGKIIHIDIDPVEINKNIKVDYSLIGDVCNILERITAKVTKQSHTQWLDHLNEYRKKFPLTYNKEVLTGPYIIETISKLTNGNAIIATEVGQHQMWTAQFYTYKHPRTLLTSGGLGTMGYGLGAAIGAKVACPQKHVFNIAGDGCFRMNMNEIATATRYNIPIIQVVMNNQVLGMVRQWQTLFYEKRYSHTILEDKVDFVKLAEAMGAKAYKITTKEEVEPVLKEAMASGVPVVIDCHIDRDDKVFPMVAPGKALEECFTEEDIRS